RMKNIKYLAVVMLLAGIASATCTTGSSGDCEVGSGKTYATIALAIAAPPAAGQTIRVFGTVVYAESPTIPAGTAGNYITLRANPGDAPQITGTVTMNSHTQLIGNCANPVTNGPCVYAVGGLSLGNPSSPGGGVSIANNATDIVIKGNFFYAAKAYNISEASGSTADQIQIAQNTFSYPCSTSSAPNVCHIMDINGNHQLIEQNDWSHIDDGPYLNGVDIILRGNVSHDLQTTDCGTHSSNCHIDAIMQADGSGGPAGSTREFIMLEKNTATNLLSNGGSVGGAGVHGIGLFQCSAGSCDHGILRFNTISHDDGGGLFCDTNNWAFLKDYNNTYVDVNRTLNQAGELFNTYTTCNNATTINSIYYFTVSLSSFSAYGYFSGSATTALFGHSLAFCTLGSTSCNTISSHIYGSGIFSSDPGNVLNSDPLFVNYASNNFNLQSGSPARNSGTGETTVNGTISGSSTLVVTDAAPFQDGWGFTVGSVQPDCIWVTSPSNHVCISSINYSTNTITLASPISATNG